jgi:hypothetical protein
VRQDNQVGPLDDRRVADGLSPDRGGQLFGTTGAAVAEQRRLAEPERQCARHVSRADESNDHEAKATGARIRARNAMPTPPTPGRNGKVAPARTRRR